MRSAYVAGMRAGAASRKREMAPQVRAEVLRVWQQVKRQEARRWWRQTVAGVVAGRCSRRAEVSSAHAAWCADPRRVR